jgi:hypothetical protein
LVELSQIVWCQDFYRFAPRFGIASVDLISET